MIIYLLKEIVNDMNLLVLYEDRFNKNKKSLNKEA